MRDIKSKVISLSTASAAAAASNSRFAAAFGNEQYSIVSSFQRNHHRGESSQSTPTEASHDLVRADPEVLAQV